jgi:hypothetical protein
MSFLLENSSVRMMTISFRLLVRILAGLVGNDQGVRTGKIGSKGFRSRLRRQPFNRPEEQIGRRLFDAEPLLDLWQWGQLGRCRCSCPSIAFCIAGEDAVPTALRVPKPRLCSIIGVGKGRDRSKPVRASREQPSILP